MSHANPLEAATGQGHDWIAARVPHQGRMCLLDRVLRATPQSIECTAASHRAADHPLARAGRLGAACGIEYAAQAMALHGALGAEARGDAKPRLGMLISVRSVELHVPRLDDMAGDLLVAAECVSDNGDHCVYQFAVSADGQPLLDGRAVVMLDVKGAPA